MSPAWMAVKHVSPVLPRLGPCERTRKTSAVFAVKSKMGVEAMTPIGYHSDYKLSDSHCNPIPAAREAGSDLRIGKSPIYASGVLNLYSVGSCHDGLLYRFCSSLNYFILSTISFAQPAARSTSPSFSGPSVPLTKKPSGDAMRVPPFLFRLPAILPAA